jgi:hypothetical protein
MHRIILNAGALCFVVALFTPVTVDLTWKPHPVYEFEVREINEYGIVNGIWYLNLAFQLIPLLIAYYARRILLSQIFIIISTILMVLITWFAGELSTFHWGGPFHGHLGIGMFFLILGNVLCGIGFFHVLSSRKEEHPDNDQILDS